MRKGITAVAFVGLIAAAAPVARAGYLPPGQLSPCRP
ncbi:MAG: hypothetical protein QOF60_2468, partial [Actinomycetota bacterium]|nr:hypothetical protein [Actinomycetota bacterium]